MNKNFLTLGEVFALCNADLGNILIEIYKANEKGEVFADDEPKYCFYIWKEYYLDYYHINEIGKVNGTIYSTLMQFYKETSITDMMDLHCIGIRETTQNDLYDNVKFAICVKY